MAARIPVIRFPEAATLVREPFDDPNWLFEIKWDGIRAICTVDARGNVSLQSRNGNDLLPRFPSLATLADWFTQRPIVVDGEIVALDRYGRSSFQLLQRHHMDDSGKPPRIRYVAFDLLFAGGRDLRNEPLYKRKELLRAIVRPGGIVMYSEHVVGKGKALFRVAQRRHLEGIVGKRRDASYEERRSPDWVKIKTGYEQETVVGGWTEPQRSRVGFGALLVGYYEGDALHYAGSVGTGFDRETVLDLRARLDRLTTARSPFDPPPKIANAHWVKPQLVAQIRFEEWTKAGLMRQPVFLGLRDDKDPRDVVRERSKRRRHP
jgi:bifunctional non-homologous end joining protein LigD